MLNSGFSLHSLLITGSLKCKRCSILVISKKIFDVENVISKLIINNYPELSLTKKHAKVSIACYLNLYAEFCVFVLFGEELSFNQSMVIIAQFLLELVETKWPLT